MWARRSRERRFNADARAAVDVRVPVDSDTGGRGNGGLRGGEIPWWAEVSREAHLGWFLFYSFSIPFPLI